METLKLRIEYAEKALKTLKAITEEPYSIIIRDAAIQSLNILLRSSGKSLKVTLIFRKESSATLPSPVSRKLSRLVFFLKRKPSKSLKWWMTEISHLTPTMRKSRKKSIAK